MELILRPVTTDDALFLFHLLATRDPKANISHRQMPTMEEHVAFIKAHPYCFWGIVNVDGIDRGAVYLSHGDEIGLHLANEHVGQGIGRAVVAQLMEDFPRKFYHVNVAPENTTSREFFAKMGFTICQFTMRYET